MRGRHTPKGSKKKPKGSIEQCLFRYTSVLRSKNFLWRHLLKQLECHFPLDGYIAVKRTTRSTSVGV
jgi:hypothetical protein